MLKLHFTKIHQQNLIYDNDFLLLNSTISLKARQSRLDGRPFTVIIVSNWLVSIAHVGFATQMGIAPSNAELTN